MKEPITICKNKKCESIIRKGQRVWHRGADLYCHSRCLMASFGVVYEKSVVLRGKEVPKESTKQERIAMMREVYARRQIKKVVAE